MDVEHSVVFCYLPCNSSTLHVVRQSHVVTPDIELPLAQAEDTAQHVSCVNSYSHIHIKSRGFSNESTASVVVVVEGVVCQARIIIVDRDRRVKDNTRQLLLYFHLPLMDDYCECGKTARVTTIRSRMRQQNRISTSVE